jgi:hypothetical protein
MSGSKFKKEKLIGKKSTYPAITATTDNWIDEF